MKEPGTPKTPAVAPSPQAPAAEACPPCPPPEEKSALPSHFARLFLGVITLLVLYFSYLIIKPYLIDIFMALVLFFTARPLFQALTRLLRGRRAPCLRPHLPHPVVAYPDPPLQSDEASLPARPWNFPAR